jgi:hypothetical protein
MKYFITTLCVVLSVFANGQTLTNKQLITEINRELGYHNWSMQGDNVIVDNGSYSFGRGLWGVSKVTYELKYEFWSLQGEGQNTFVLYIKCKNGNNCIEDPGNPELEDFDNVLRIPIHDDERRAQRVLSFLLQLK